MGNAFITKGSTIVLGTGATELKGIVIEDFDIGVGDQGQESSDASDGTKYTFIGNQEDNSLELPVLFTDDSVTALLDEVYGAGSTVAGGTEWQMRNAGTNITSIKITSPFTSDTVKIEFEAVNPKGIGILPKFVKTKGYESVVKMTMDYWLMRRLIS